MNTEEQRSFSAASVKLEWNADPEHDELVTLTPNQCRAVLVRLRELEAESQRWQNRATMLGKQCQTMTRDLRAIARISRGSAALTQQEEL